VSSWQAGVPACHYCGAEVRPDDREVWRLAVGWERPGQAGGSDIVCRTPARPARFACPPCVASLRATGNALQADLFGNAGGV